MTKEPALNAANGHTPGPWHVEPVNNEDGEQFWSDDWNGKVFCVCHPQTVCTATTVVDWINEADARLIATAPDLLAALEECAPELRVMSEWASGPTSEAYSEKYARAIAAIAKAKGAA